MKSSSEYRMQARERLSGNWGNFALLMLVFFAASIGASFVPYLGSLVELILTGPLTLGFIICMLNLMQGEAVVLEDVLDGFKNFVPAMLVYILTMIFTILWTFLLIIPGIMAAYSYSMCFYILKENPEMPPMDVIKESKRMMNGHRMDLFGLQLSFIGWGLLSILSLGIGYLWVAPYMTASITAFYLDLKGAPTASLNEPMFYQNETEFVTEEKESVSTNDSTFL